MTTKFMKQFIQGTSFFLLLQTASGIAFAQTAEHDAVHQTMKKLLRSFETADSQLLFQTFRRDGIVHGYSTKRGQVVTQSAVEWSTGFDGKPAEDEAQRSRRYEILDISGNAAIVKFLLDYPTWQGVDYLSLRKIDGTWQVISKSWSGQVKQAAKS